MTKQSTQTQQPQQPVSTQVPSSLSVITVSESVTDDPLPFSAHALNMELQHCVHDPHNRWWMTCFSMLVNVLLLTGAVAAAVIFTNEEDTVHRGVWTAYALFISTRCLANIILAVYRYTHPTLWINQHTQLHVAHMGQKVVYWIRVVFLVLSCLFLFTLFVYFLVVDFNDTENDSPLTKWYLTVLGVELAGLMSPVTMYASWLYVWSYKSLSCFIPFIPINYSAFKHFTSYHEQLEKNGRNGLSKQLLSRLPIERYHQSLLPDHADRNCPICLNEFNEREKVRILHCQHVYHQACVDAWLKHRGTCPLCVRVVAPASDIQLEPVGGSLRQVLVAVCLG